MKFAALLAPIAKTSSSLALVLAISLVVAQPASAGVPAPGWVRNSLVTDSVVDNGGGSWTYGYTVHNTSFQPGPETLQPIVVDWELPWFGDAGIANIVSPVNWAYSVETIGTPNGATGWAGVAAWQDPSDPFYAGAGSPFTTVTEVLHWYNLCWLGIGFPTDASASTAVGCEGQFDGAIFPGNSLDGFGFDADFAPVGAPYQASWASLPVRTGDPAFPLGGIPNSPNVRGPQAVPEPGVLGLLGIGLAALLLRRRRAA